MHRKALGKGLEALIPGTVVVDGVDPKSAGIRQVPID